MIVAWDVSHEISNRQEVPFTIVAHEFKIVRAPQITHIGFLGREKVVQADHIVAFTYKPAA